MGRGLRIRCEQQADVGHRPNGQQRDLSRSGLDYTPHELHSLIFRELFAVIPAFKHRSLRDVLLLVVSEDSAAGSGVNRDIRAAAF